MWAECGNETAVEADFEVFATSKQSRNKWYKCIGPCAGIYSAVDKIGNCGIQSSLVAADYLVYYSYILMLDGVVVLLAANVLNKAAKYSSGSFVDDVDSSLSARLGRVNRKAGNICCGKIVIEGQALFPRLDVSSSLFVGIRPTQRQYWRVTQHQHARRGDGGGEVL